MDPPGAIAGERRRRRNRHLLEGRADVIPGAERDKGGRGKCYATGVSERHKALGPGGRCDSRLSRNAGGVVEGGDWRGTD